MTDTKTLNEWMRQHRFEWVDGHEQLMKGEMTYEEAAHMIGQLLRQGAVTRG